MHTPLWSNYTSALPHFHITFASCDPIHGGVNIWASSPSVEWLNWTDRMAPSPECREASRPTEYMCLYMSSCQHIVLVHPDRLMKQKTRIHRESVSDWPSCNNQLSDCNVALYSLIGHNQVKQGYYNNNMNDEWYNNTNIRNPQHYGCMGNDDLDFTSLYRHMISPFLHESTTVSCELDKWANIIRSLTSEAISNMTYVGYFHLSYTDKMEWYRMWGE